MGTTIIICGILGLSLLVLLVGYISNMIQRNKNINALLRGLDKQHPLYKSSTVKEFNRGHNEMRMKREENAIKQRVEMTKARNVPDKFPNGFENWHETHFEMTSAIVKSVDWSGSRARYISETMGTGGLYELARGLTNKFEREHQGKEWGVDDDTQYFDALAVFLTENLKPVR